MSRFNRSSLGVGVRSALGVWGASSGGGGGDPPCPPEFDIQCTVAGLDGGPYSCRAYTGTSTAKHWARIDELQNVDGTYDCTFLICSSATDPSTGKSRPTAIYGIDFGSGNNAWLSGRASRVGGCASVFSETIVSRCGPSGTLTVYRDNPVEVFDVRIFVGATFTEPADPTRRREFYATVFGFRHQSGAAPVVADADAAPNTPGNFVGESISGCASGSPFAARFSTSRPTDNAGTVTVEFVP